MLPHFPAFRSVAPKNRACPSRVRALRTSCGSGRAVVCHPRLSFASEKKVRSAEFPIACQETRRDRDGSRHLAGCAVRVRRLLSGRRELQAPTFVQSRRITENRQRDQGAKNIARHPFSSLYSCFTYLISQTGLSSRPSPHERLMCFFRGRGSVRRIYFLRRMRHDRRSLKISRIFSRHRHSS